MKQIINKIIYSFKNNKNLYIGEQITISEHMIQTAMLAEKNNSPKYFICACLLHDFGHFIIDDPDLFVLKSLDGKHEDIGYNFLVSYFKPEIVEPIKLHVKAKRYLCRNIFYINQLSKASMESLKLQGGTMEDKEVKQFISSKFSKDAITLRKYDDHGKKDNFNIKKIEDYINLINSQLLN